MEARKRTRSGRSERQRVSQSLGVVAHSQSEKTITLSFEVLLYETQWNLELTYKEARDLADSMNSILRKGEGER
jgi:hypothetical protein